MSSDYDSKALDGLLKLSLVCIGVSLLLPVFLGLIARISPESEKPAFVFTGPVEIDWETERASVNLEDLELLLRRNR